LPTALEDTKVIYLFLTSDHFSIAYHADADPAKATSVAHFKSAYRRVFSFYLKQD